VRDSIVKQLTALLLVATACGLVACGGGGKSATSRQASQTQAGTQTQADARSGGGGSSGSGGAAGTQSRRTGSASRDGASPQTGSGGAGAPRLQGPVRKRTLLRYLTVHYRETVWYPLLKRLQIGRSHVGVYLNFSPADDDENPPVMACEAVLSYGRQVKQVTVYGNRTPQGKLVAMKRC
jgi:hypothetical protein